MRTALTRDRPFRGRLLTFATAVMCQLVVSVKSTDRGRGLVLRQPLSNLPEVDAGTPK